MMKPIIKTTGMARIARESKTYERIQLRAGLNLGEVDIIAGLRQVGKGLVCIPVIPRFASYSIGCYRAGLI